MCGRYELNCTPAELRSHFGALLSENCWDDAGVTGSYNIAPSRPCPVIRYGKREGHNVLGHLIWGFRPSWARKPWINARDDRLFETPAFRDAARRRRALVIATGWYEWQRLDGRHKQPYYIHLNHIIAFAGVWTARKLDGDTWELSFAIITTASAGILRDIHPRMPLVMSPEDYAAWLDPNTPSPEALLRPFDPARLMAHPVSTLVNTPANDSAACIAPLDDASRPRESSQRGAV